MAGPLSRSTVLVVLVALSLALAGPSCSRARLKATDLGDDPGDLDAGGADTGNPDTGFIELGGGGGTIPPTLEHFTAIDTVVTAEPVTAGSEVAVTCLGRDLNGAWRSIASRDPDVVARPETSFGEAETPLHVRPIIAGDGLVSCELPSQGLIDETPAMLRIEPGSPYRSLATPDRTQVRAGGILRVSCEFFDAFGNTASAEGAEVRTDPFDGGVIHVEPQVLSIERAGLYTITCDLPGIFEAFGEVVDVIPGLPAALAVTLVPPQPVYGAGQVITLAVDVTDRFGNQVPTAEVVFTSTPEGESFGEGRFVFWADGTYTLRAEVRGPTEGGIPLSAEVAVAVSGFGPSLRCVNPADAGWIDASPGDIVPLEGVADDANGVASVNVEGVPVALDADGTFVYSGPVEFGVNFVDLEATDDFGDTNSVACAYIAADEWAGPTEIVDDSLMLRLNQAAIDDGNPSDGLDSLNDILHAVVNSQGLIDAVDSALRAANPLKPESCDAEVCLIFFCFCAFESEINYQDFELNGPNQTTLQLVEGGLRTAATLRGLGVRIDADATIDANGWLRFGSLTVDLTMNLAVSDGRPRASLRSVNSVSVSGIDLDFRGLVGLIIDLIEGLFHGLIQDLVEDTLRDFIADSFDDVLDGVLGGLDVSALGSTFDVPRLDGSGVIPVDLGLRVSRLEARATHLLFGLGTRFSAPPTRPATVPEAPLPPGPRVAEPITGMAVGASVYSGLFNQVLYALWLGGFFDVTMTGTDIGGDLPADAVVALRAELPPVVRFRADKSAEISFGAFQMAVVYPGVLAEPLPVILGARLQARVGIVDDAFVFDGFEITELVFHTPTASLDRETRAVLEDFFSRLAMDVAADALSTALPAVPIPGFEIPASVATFGLPAGRELGLVRPIFETSGNHFVFESDFGLK